MIVSLTLHKIEQLVDSIRSDIASKANSELSAIELHLANIDDKIEMHLSNIEDRLSEIADEITESK